MKDDPTRLAAETTNPRAQWGEDGAVLFVWREHSCGSSIAITVAQETQCALAARKGAMVLAQGWV